MDGPLQTLVAYVSKHRRIPLCTLHIVWLMFTSHSNCRRNGAWAAKTYEVSGCAAGEGAHLVCSQVNCD